MKIRFYASNRPCNYQPQFPPRKEKKGEISGKLQGRIFISGKKRSKSKGVL